MGWGQADVVSPQIQSLRHQLQVGHQTGRLPISDRPSDLDCFDRRGPAASLAASPASFRFCPGGLGESLDSAPFNGLLFRWRLLVLDWAWFIVWACAARAPS